MKIEIIKISSADGGNLRGYFDVEIEGMIIRTCRIIQQPKTKAYCAGPQVKFGEKHWFTVVSFPLEIREQIQELVLPRAQEMGMITT